MSYSALVKRWTDKESGRLPIIVRDQQEDYRKASEADPKRFSPLKERIFPAAYGPVVYRNEQEEFIF